MISRIYGGLGNQLFQYAIARSIVYRTNDELLLDNFDFLEYNLRNMELCKFNIVGQIATKKDVYPFRIDNKVIDRIMWKLNKLGWFIKKEKYYEKKDYVFDRVVINSSNIKYLQGYWQSYKYFQNIKYVLLEELTIKEKLTEYNLELMDAINCTNSVSIHIRRGDYMQHNIYHSISMKYYRNAVRYMQNKLENPIFYIFSDDLTWVKQNINIDGSFIYVDVNTNDSAEFDLELMKNCKHNIIANSSFSWWGAWLNQNQNQIVISPNKWVSYVNNLDDLLPPDWIRMSI